MSRIKSDKSLILISAILILLSVMLSFVSNHYESRVMGDAALGVAVLAPDLNSPEWAEKNALRSKADLSFNLSIICGVLAVFLQLYVALRNP